MFAPVLPKNSTNLGRGVHLLRFHGQDFLLCTSFYGTEEPAGRHGVRHRLELKKQLRLPHEIFCVTLIAGESVQLIITIIMMVIVKRLSLKALGALQKHERGGGKW